MLYPVSHEVRSQVPMSRVWVLKTWSGFGLEFIIEEKDSIYIGHLVKDVSSKDEDIAFVSFDPGSDEQGLALWLIKDSGRQLSLERMNVWFIRTYGDMEYKCYLPVSLLLVIYYCRMPLDSEGEFFWSK